VRSTHFPARGARTVLAMIAVAVAVAVAGCGGSGAVKPTNLSLRITEAGKAAQFTIPASGKSGLANIVLVNSGQAPHSAQLVLVTRGHTVADAVHQIGGNSNKTPTWLRAEGGVGTTPGGQTGTAIVNLPKGNYAIIDTASLRGGGPPAYGQTKLSGGKIGKVPKYAAHITGLSTGKDKYAWRIAGLKVGTNPLDFVSKGKRTLHLVTAFKLKGTANPSVDAIKKALQSNGPPPSYVDQTSQVDTAALDSGKSLATSLTFTRGQYVFFCPLTDRDGGKPHFLEGMLKKVTIG
jgi:hypothetical protein